MNELNLVLDMDSTLISNFGYNINPRPHLQLFLTFCFLNCKTISIWTAAEQSWFDAVNNALFQPILQKISARLRKKCQFRFVFVRQRGTIKFTVRPENQYQPTPIFVKELDKLWNSPFQFPEFTPHNTLIVDDTPETYSQNFRNAIQILPFAFNNKQDRELLKLMLYLKELGQHYQEYKTILNADKRQWFFRNHIVQGTLQFILNANQITNNRGLKVKTI